MENSVIIKSYKDGIAVYLNDTIPFDSLLNDVGTKFRESAKFFGNMKVALSLEGRALSPLEETQLVDVITTNSHLQIICLVGKDDAKEKFFVRALSAVKQHDPKTEESGKFYRGNLKDSQILECEGSIVVIGDVAAGCSVISTKDIIILGRLYGNAYAGGDGDSSHFIAALLMAPQKLKIGDFKYHTKDLGKTVHGLRKSMPQAAVVKNAKIQMQEITKEALDELSVGRTY